MEDSRQRPDSLKNKNLIASEEYVYGDAGEKNNPISRTSHDDTQTGKRDGRVNHTKITNPDAKEIDLCQNSAWIMSREPVDENPCGSSASSWAIQFLKNSLVAAWTDQGAK